MFPRTQKILTLSAISCLVAVVVLSFVLTSQYSRVTSPDNRFYAVATFAIWRSYVPMMPGQSGDKPGRITIYSADGRSCGSTPVEMVSFIRNLEWGEDRAQIRLVAEWDLANRRVQKLQ